MTFYSPNFQLPHCCCVTIIVMYTLLYYEKVIKIVSF